MRPHVEIRSTLLDNGEKQIFVIKWHRIWQNCVHVLLFLEVISKENFEGAT